MTTKATEKIVDALSQLLEGYNELQEFLRQEYGTVGDTYENDDDDDDDDESDEESSPEVEAALVTEIKAALESVIESDDFDPEEVANVLTALTEALEEIDPTVFNHEEEADTGYEAEEEVDDVDLDDEDEYDLDEDDDDLDYDEDDDDDEDDYEEDEDD
ncbi:MAG: hypothetical protein J5J00_12875 [Deltaproteobacteria bacterium]|nr:hypothetical protein [Deltaproteobacteria bacterium]